MITLSDDKPGYISADAYSVSRQVGGVSIGYVPLIFKDSEGSIVLTANKSGIGRHATLVDQNGQKVGEVQKKGISLGSSAKYQFFDGSGTQIGQVVVRTSLMGMNELIQMQDPSGAPVASASGNFAGFNYQIFDADGKKVLARIYRDTKQNQQGGGLKGLLANIASATISMAIGAYKVEILEKSINDMSRLFILELIVVLDDMYQPNQGAGATFDI